MEVRMGTKVQSAAIFKKRQTETLEIMKEKKLTWSDISTP